MGKRKRSQPERVLHGHVGPQLTAFIHAVTDDPDVRRVMAECAAAFAGGAAAEAWSQTGRAQRGALVLALRSAAEALLSGRPCDLCAAPAVRIRFFYSGPGEDRRGVRPPGPNHAVLGFAVLCPGCSGRPADRLKAKLLEKYAALQAETDGRPFYQAVVVGRPIGSASGIPRRRALGDCTDCAVPLWYDQDEQDWLMEPTQNVLLLCPACARARQEAGRLFSVPGALLGGPPAD